MKESIATTSIFKLVLTFTVLFAAFLSVAITYNRVYKLKNETLAMIEKYEGVNTNSSKSVISIINNYLHNSGYNTKGKCETSEYGVADLTSNKYELARSNKEYFYCLNYFCKDSNCNISKDRNQIFYNLKLFFKFNIPFFGELFTFKITGDTKGIKLYDEGQKLS